MVGSRPEGRRHRRSTRTRWKTRMKHDDSLRRAERWGTGLCFIVIPTVWVPAP